MHICTQGPHVLLTFMGSHSARCTTCNAWSPGVCVCMCACVRVRVCSVRSAMRVGWGGGGGGGVIGALTRLSSDHTKPPAGAGVLRDALLRKASREPTLLTR
jgi:hypothetical protein